MRHAAECSSHEVEAAWPAPAESIVPLGPTRCTSRGRRPKFGHSARSARPSSPWALSRGPVARLKLIQI